MPGFGRVKACVPLLALLLFVSSGFMPSFSCLLLWKARGIFWEGFSSGFRLPEVRCQVPRINKQCSPVRFVFSDFPHAVGIPDGAVCHAGHPCQLSRKADMSALENRELIQPDCLFKFFKSAHFISAFRCCIMVSNRANSQAVLSLVSRDIRRVCRLGLRGGWGGVFVEQKQVSPPHCI